MRIFQVQSREYELDVYIPIRDEKSFQQGTIELYQSVLNESVQNSTVEPIVRDYILKEHEGFKLLCRSKEEVRHLAKSLQQELNRWIDSPEGKEKFLSSIVWRARRNRIICLIASVLTITLGYYAKDDLPVVGEPPQGLRATLLALGSTGLGASTVLLAHTGRDMVEDNTLTCMLTCIKNRLFPNLGKEYLYSIFSSKSLNDPEFKRFESSHAGIENISNIVLNYL